MRTIVVVPTYCEAENIIDVLGRIRVVAPEVDVLVVDDDSPDGTAELAMAVGRELGQVAVLRRPARNGLGAAYRAGFERGLAEGYDVLVEMDADLSHDPAALPQLLAAVRGGADLAIGSRYVDGGSVHDWSRHRRLLSSLGNRYASVLLGLGVADATSGYRAYRADLLHRVDAIGTHAEGYGFQIELIHRAARRDARIVEVPIAFRDRVRGTSKMSARIIAEASLLVLRLRAEDRKATHRVAPAPGSAPVTVG